MKNINQILRGLTALVRVALLILILPQAALAAPGDPDPTFGSGGTTRADFDEVCGSLEEAPAFFLGFQPGGEIVGQGGCPGSVRYSAAGALDTQFESSRNAYYVDDFFTRIGFFSPGYYRASHTVPGPFVIDTVGKILLAGGNNGNFAVGRLKSDGTVDTTFGNGGLAEAVGMSISLGGSSLALQTDGKILEGGGVSACFGVVRYTPDGILDTTFGNGGLVITPFPDLSVGGVTNLALQTDGKIVAAGTDSSGNIVLARYNADGTLDTTFGSGGRVASKIHSDHLTRGVLAIDADGKIVAVGNDGDVHILLARFTKDGIPDPTFGVNHDGQVTSDVRSTLNSMGFVDSQVVSLARQADGKIVVAVWADLFCFTSVCLIGPMLEHFMWHNSFTNNYRGFFCCSLAVLRYTPDGALDTTFGWGGLTGLAQPALRTTTLYQGVDSSGLALQSDGKIVVAGSGWFPSLNQVLARYLNDVGSPASATGAGPVMFSTSAGTFATLTAVPEGKLSTAGVTFPYGLFDWTVTGLANEQSITVTMTFPNPVPDGVKYWKVVSGGWTDMTSLLSRNPIDNKVLYLTITDGGFGDLDGLANGQITDPGGIAISAVTPVIGADTTPPVITPNITGTLGNNGWYTSNVSVSWNMTDAESAISSSSGCENSTVSSDTAGVTFTCSATSAGGTATNSVTIKLDKTSPVISSTQTPSPNPAGWNKTPVKVDFTCSDALSGIETCPASVTVSAEGKDLPVSGTATDKAGNSAPAIRTLNIDLTPPSIAIGVPAGGTYLINQPVAASYTCTDSGSGVANCDGPVISGGPLDTRTVGAKTFVVNAKDQAENMGSASANYAVAYNICLLYDPSKAKKLGSTVPVKLQICDSNGANLSSSAITVTATDVVLQSTMAVGTLDDSGSANPDYNFRYDSTLAGYIYNLDTKALQTGTYKLMFTVSGDPVTHGAGFQLR
jgi:uncharacterized delta-60 repeat protein